MQRYSDEIVNVVKQFLTEEDWHYSFHDDTGIFRFGVRIRSKIQNINYVIVVSADEFCTYGICPIVADSEDSEMMAQMAEFICRANYGLKYGCFELDFRDGEIRFRSYVNCESQVPSTAVVRSSVHSTAAMIERYAQGIVDIIFGEATAKDAIARCEKFVGEEFHSAEDVRSALEEVLGADVSEEDVEALLSRLALELGITEEEDDDHEDEDRPEDIRLNPFADGDEADPDQSHIGADGDGADPDQPHIRMDLFATEGGED